MLIFMERNRTGCRFVISARATFRMTRYFPAFGLSCKKLMPKNSLRFGSFELKLGNEKGHFKEKASADCFREVLFAEQWNRLRKIATFKCPVVIDPTSVFRQMHTIVYLEFIY